MLGYQIRLGNSIIPPIDNLRLIYQNTSTRTQFQFIVVVSNANRFAVINLPTASNSQADNNQCTNHQKFFHVQSPFLSKSIRKNHPPRQAKTIRTALQTKVRNVVPDRICSSLMANPKKSSLDPSGYSNKYPHQQTSANLRQ